VEQVPDDLAGALLDGVGVRALTREQRRQLRDDVEGERPAVTGLGLAWFENDRSTLEVDVPPLARGHFVPSPAGPVHELAHSGDGGRQVLHELLELSVLEEARPRVLDMHAQHRW
jgi:hypothetical protein